MFRLSKSIFFSLFITLTLISSAHAQRVPGVETPLEIVVSPTNPKPSDTVTFSLSSFSFDLDRATITWTLDGKVIAKGIGTRTASATAGKLGTIKSLRVSAVVPGSGTYSATASIRPAEVALVWQTTTYVPPFYKGKALPSFGGGYKIVAQPEMTDKSGKKLDPSKLIYTWKKNDATDATASGYGKNVYMGSQSSFLQQGDDIRVEVTYPSENFTTSANTSIVPVAPEIHFYEKSPLYGTIYERELGSVLSLRNEEITLAAEPYFFSTNKKEGSLMNHLWTINGQSAANFDNKGALTLRRTALGSGKTEVEIISSNTARVLQSAGKNIVIFYE